MGISPVFVTILMCKLFKETHPGAVLIINMPSNMGQLGWGSQQGEPGVVRKLNTEINN